MESINFADCQKIWPTLILNKININYMCMPDKALQLTVIYKDKVVKLSYSAALSRSSKENAATCCHRSSSSFFLGSYSSIRSDTIKLFIIYEAATTTKLRNGKIKVKTKWKFPFECQGNCVKMMKLYAVAVQQAGKLSHTHTVASLSLIPHVNLPSSHKG